MSALRKAFVVLGATLALSALASPASAFVLKFDESGNGCLLNADSICTTPDNGILGPDPTGGVAGNVLIFSLPQQVNLGSVGISDPDGSLSDVLRFADIGATAPDFVMIFYSTDIGAGLPADSGLPGSDFIIGTTEDANGNFDWEPGGNSYLGFSPEENVPEPVTLSLFGAGLAGAAAMRRRKKQVA
jgi:hypothetical protein